MKPLQTLSLALIAMALQFQAYAEDAVFRLKPTKVTVEKKVIVDRKDLEQIPVPKCKSLVLYTTPDSEGYYCILIGLAEKPPEGFRPIIVLGESTLTDEVELVVAQPDPLAPTRANRELGYSISIKTKDKSIAEEWTKRIKVLFFPGQ